MGPQNRFSLISFYLYQVARGGNCNAPRRLINSDSTRNYNLRETRRKTKASTQFVYASDWIGVTAQLSTFFVFQSALMIQVDAVHYRKALAQLLLLVTLVPSFIGFCWAGHAAKSSLQKIDDEYKSSPEKEDKQQSDSAGTDSSQKSSLLSPQVDEGQPSLADSV